MRSNSQSLKVSNWLSNHLNNLGQSSLIIDLQVENLPFFDDGDTAVSKWESLSNKLAESEGYIFVSPEWNGSMSAGLLNLLQYVDKEMAHKPVMLVGVSSGRGGHYPLIQMRSIGYKNRQFVIIPESLLVQDCNNVLNDHEESDGVDGYVKNRADYSLRILLAYAKALVSVRNSSVIDFNKFPNGV